ncbi:PTS sugar transporter subunit IIA [Paenibacillus terrae]|uniref:PTS sugar transporter subunit IIA n=1 Tax=Paenibacillus terrae TaxID=159743 RepID=UPI0011EAA187|nr:PTS glucose transporter subunit IIA [Paenibacillus terrae]
MFGRKKKNTDLSFLEISSPVSGQFVPLDNVEDEAFSTKAMGEGFAILPDTGKVIAPFDGIIAHIMEKSKHAILIQHQTGTQLLIHVGMNTVSLKGEGFKMHVKNGDRVKKGQLLLEFDIDRIRQAGYSTVTPIIVPNGQDNVKRVEVDSTLFKPLEDTVLRVYY